MQSGASVVLEMYQELLQDHLVITLYLTMLVGAGGNAGNQSAIKVVRGLATGEMQVTCESLLASLREQTVVGLVLSSILATLGFVRVYADNSDFLDSFAISASLFLIVLSSVEIGTLLPYGLAKAGLDPLNAATSIQVVMDIVGVLITCSMCHILFTSPTFLDGLSRG
eukprot:SM000047S16864  [mRNA]  locus=s47:428079:429401:+ [translate_table: standard]